jgi:hypothetical protein
MEVTRKLHAATAIFPGERAPGNNIVMCRVVHETKMTASRPDDWIY